MFSTYHRASFYADENTDLSLYTSCNFYNQINLQFTFGHLIYKYRYLYFIPESPFSPIALTRPWDAPGCCLSVLQNGFRGGLDDAYQTADLDLRGSSPRSPTAPPESHWLGEKKNTATSMETKRWIKSHVQNRNLATSDKLSIKQFLSCSYHQHYSSKKLLKLATVAIRFGRRWVLEREDDGEGSIIMASWYQDRQQHNWASECPENLTSLGAWKLHGNYAFLAIGMLTQGCLDTVPVFFIGCMCRFCCQFRVGSVACVNMGRLPHHRLEIWPWQRCRKLKKRKSHSKLAKISLNSSRM